MKRQVNLTIDVDIMNKVRALGINVSKAVEDFLRDLVDSGGLSALERDLKQLEDQLDELYKAKEEIDEYIKKTVNARDKCREKLEELREQEARKHQQLLDTFDKIPEVQNLTKEQITNTDLLLKLVGVIREKYGVRIGVTDVREYYKMKGLNT